MRGSRSGVPDSATVRHPHNLADLVREAARAHPDRPAIIWQNQLYTWSWLDAQVDRVAGGLATLALTGDGAYPARVALALTNVPEFAVAFFGVLRAGLVAVPVNPGYTARELGQVLRDSGAELLIGNAATLATATESGAAPRHTVLAGAGSAPGAVPLADLAPPATPETEVAGGTAEPGADGAGESGAGGEQLAVLVYTSGTEGDPKGAMLTHRALLANHEQLAPIEPPPIGPDDVLLLGLPLFHAYGLNCGLGALAYHGATGVLVERFDPAEIAPADRRARGDRGGRRTARCMWPGRCCPTWARASPACGWRSAAPRRWTRPPPAASSTPPGTPSSRGTG